MQAITLFKKYAGQLNFLKSHGMLKNIVLQYYDTYICPICLRQFSDKDLDKNAFNQLTKEHAPLNAGGGKEVALLCKQCNSESGSDYDSHLIERLLEIDQAGFLPGTEYQGKLVHDDNCDKINVTLRTLPNGDIYPDIDKKRNNPKILEKYGDI